MKSRHLFVHFFTLLAASQCLASQAYSVAGDLKWSGYKFHDLNDSHTGDLKLKSGQIQMDGNNILNGEFVIDMTTLSYKNKKLEKHLKSADFFDVESFKDARFVITKSETLAIVGPSGETHRIEGPLTIRNKTNPIVFLATLQKVDSGWVAKSNFSIPDRSKFDINYKSPAVFGLAKLADKAIADEIKIQLNLKAISKTQ